MNNIVYILKDHLILNDYTILKLTNKKVLIFKSFSKYTKCIYINLLEDSIEVKIDKIFDSLYFYPAIERLLVSRKNFNNIYESVKHIQKNITSNP